MPVDRQLSLIQTELEIFAIRRPELAGRFVAINNRFRERIGSFIDEAMQRYGRELLVDPSILTDAIVGDRGAERAARPPCRWRRGPGRDGQRDPARAPARLLEAGRGLNAPRGARRDARRDATP